ncbi:MAG: [FeFe] hydrogenase H-cluster radical SAM maturase HydG, partial [Cellulosilyticaceae bacterium]
MFNEKVDWYHVADEWFGEDYIRKVLEEGAEKAKDPAYVESLLEKAGQCIGLSHQEAAVLLQVEKAQLEEQMKGVARHIKEKIYGKRVVLFAPLYVSDYCVNNCDYCGYKHSNTDHKRR